LLMVWAPMVLIRERMSWIARTRGRTGIVAMFWAGCCCCFVVVVLKVKVKVLEVT
jgi:hypothetical protein